MTIVMLDTNVVIAVMKSQTPVRLHYASAISAGRTLAISSIVENELWFGICKSSRGSRNEAALQLLLASDLTVATFDSRAARRTGEVRAALAAKGTPIGPMDTLIAGHALELGATLVTANTREFARVTGLAQVDWSK